DKGFRILPKKLVFANSLRAGTAYIGRGGGGGPPGPADSEPPSPTFASQTISSQCVPEKSLFKGLSPTPPSFTAVRPSRNPKGHPLPSRLFKLPWHWSLT